MDIKDLTGLSEPLKKLIEVISQGIGAVGKPYLIRKTADAKAYEIKVISQAIRDNQQDLKEIGFNDEKLSLMSLDSNSIQKELSIEERTQQRIDFKEQKRQKNIESITQKAVENLESETTVSEEPVDEDWTTRFFNYAEDISNEEMQVLWGRILAGEIKKPRSYSLRTLEILRNLSKEEAQVFMKFASLSIKSSGVSFILNFKDEKILEEKYKLKFNERLLLEELGFITANDLQFKIGKTENSSRQIVFIIGNICVIQNKLENKAEQQLQVLVFTKIGQELLSLVNFAPQLDYIQLLTTKLNRMNGSVQYGQILQYLPTGQIRHTPLMDVPLTEIEQENKKRENEEKK
ncbi:DUF2806 domain-containing protein [Bacteroidales bacterium MB20-C3-3]|nr:DUF2806 domain-containing protein [Bacteroidales bacterium MB20-C3-3]